MGPSEVQRRQEFLGLTEADGEAVRSLRAVFRTHADAFAERFYRHLLSSPSTAPFLRDPAVLERLKRLQADYFAELLEGLYDDEYVRKRLRVGHTHQRVGLEPISYLGAYNQYIQIAFPLFVEAFGDNLTTVLPALLSLVKVIFFDISLALDTYFTAATEQLRRRNEELQQALALVQRTQQREEQLRRLLSHEVRGGLAAMIVALEDVLDGDGVQGEPRDELETVLRRAWSLTGMLTEMLAALQTGGPGRVETGELLAGLRQRFALYAAGLDVELVLPAEAPPVWADALQLREVFANLLANAVRYLGRPRGRVEVSVRAFDPALLPAGSEESEEKKHPAGNFVLFGVHDDGPGLPEGLRDRLFEPFVHGSEGPSKRDDRRGLAGVQAGTGLGLYFVRTVVEQGGGRIWCETRPGAGTCFWFTVPAPPPELLGAPHG